MIRIREAILVEGRYDKNALSQLVDTAIFETVFKQVSMPLGNIRFIRLKPQQHFLRTPCAM